jgi:hypothetical protein
MKDCSSMAGYRAVLASEDAKREAGSLSATAEFRASMQPAIKILQEAIKVSISALVSVGSVHCLVTFS